MIETSLESYQEPTHNKIMVETNSESHQEPTHHQIEHRQLRLLSKPIQPAPERKVNNSNPTINRHKNKSASIFVRNDKVYKPRIRTVLPNKLQNKRHVMIVMIALLVLNFGLTLCNFSYIHLVRGGYKSKVINGEWSEWYAMNECLENCFDQRKHEVRLCNNPQPSYNGKRCVGNATRYVPCGTGKCRGCYPCKTPADNNKPYYYCDCRENALHVTDCKDLHKKRMQRTGLYRLNLSKEIAIDVFCDKNWLVFQRRIDGTENFLRNWHDYKYGFGELSRELWLGNEYLHMITTKYPTELEILLEDWNGVKRYARYSSFKIESETTGYMLRIAGYHGTAGNSLAYHNNTPFTTIDRDNDLDTSNCAQKYHGAWWYKLCHEVNLNGVYYNKGGFGSQNIYEDGIHWMGVDRHKDSLKRVEMKLRKT